MCRDKDPLDCVGLAGHFVLGADGLPRDISHNGWQLTPVATYSYNSQTLPRVRGGPNSLFLDGNDDRYDLGTRSIAGEMSFCAWVHRASNTFWSRVVGLGVTTNGGADRFEFGAEGWSENAFLSINSEGTFGRTIYVPDFW